MVKRAFLLLAFLLFLTPAAWAKEWRGIVPLHSTRADVERLLGEGDCRLDECLYYLDDVRVVFHYSPGDCGGGYAWKIPKDMVHWITVEPKEPPLLSDLKIDMSKFGKIQMGHIEGEVNYLNEAEGISIQTIDGTVRSFIYGPTAEEKLHLHCAENSNRGLFYNHPQGMRAFISPSSLANSLGT